MDVDALARDNASTEKADAGDHLGRDPGRIALANNCGKNDKAAGAERHQRISA